MLETPHVAVGAAIAASIPNPLIAIPLAFASHFVLELVPHWNPHLNTEMRKHGKLTRATRSIIALDVTASLFVGGVISYWALPDTAHALTILSACFAAALPDVLEAPYFLFGIKNKFLSWWLTLKKSIQNDAGVVFGLATQFVTILAAFYWVFTLNP
jgi:hypothetical protein